MASFPPIAGAIVPGADVVLGLVKEVWTLYERIKEIKGAGEVCRALSKRLELLANRLEDDRAKLLVNSRIVTVLDEYIKTVEEFKVCLNGWIKIDEEHKYSTGWRLKDVPERIKEFDEKITKLHEKLNYAHIIETEVWMQTDSEWKEQLEDELAQLGTQQANDGSKTRDHMTEWSNMIIPTTLELVTSRCEKLDGAQWILVNVLPALELVFDLLQQRESAVADTGVVAFCTILGRLWRYVRTATSDKSVYAQMRSRKVAASHRLVYVELDKLLDSLQVPTDDPIRSWRLELVSSTISAASPNGSAAAANEVDSTPITLNHLDTPLAAYKQWTQAGLKEAATLEAPDWRPAWYLSLRELVFSEADKLGQGAFGAVYRGLWRDAPVVIKFMGYDDDIKTIETDMLLHEVRVWHRLNHPHVLKFYGASHVDKRYFVCELAGDELSKYLEQPGNEHLVWQKLHEAALGLKYLHDNGVAHNDLKGDNILVALDGKAKLIDFGMSCLLGEAEIQVAKKSIGAVNWRSPEYLTGGRPSRASDVYSFGMCILEVVSEDVPWGRYVAREMVPLRVLSGKLPEQPHTMPDRVWDLVTRMCHFDPTARPSMASVISELSKLAENEVELASSVMKGEADLTTTSAKTMVIGNSDETMVGSQLRSFVGGDDDDTLLQHPLYDYTRSEMNLWERESIAATGALPKPEQQRLDEFDAFEALTRRHTSSASQSERVGIHAMQTDSDAKSVDEEDDSDTIAGFTKLNSLSAIEDNLESMSTILPHTHSSMHRVADLLTVLRSANASDNDDLNRLVHSDADRKWLKAVDAVTMAALITAALDSGKLRWTKLLLLSGAPAQCMELRENAALATQLFAQAVNVLDQLLLAASIVGGGATNVDAKDAVATASTAGTRTLNAAITSEFAALRITFTNVVKRLLAFCSTYAQPRNIFVAVASGRHVLWELETIRQRLDEVSEKLRRHTLAGSQRKRERDGTAHANLPSVETMADAKEDSRSATAATAATSAAWHELLAIRVMQLQFVLQETRDLSRILPDRSVELEVLTLLQAARIKMKRDGVVRTASATDDDDALVNTDKTGDFVSTDWYQTVVAAHDKVARICGYEHVPAVPVWFVPSYVLAWDPEHVVSEGSFTTLHVASRTACDAMRVAVKRLKMHGLGGVRSHDSFMHDIERWYACSREFDAIDTDTSTSVAGIGDAAAAIATTSSDHSRMDRHHHPHILKLLGASHVSRRAYLVVEHAVHGNVLTYLQQQQQVADATTSRIWEMFHDAAVALQYLHARGIMHGHVTCANIVVTSDERAKLTDFGFLDVRSAVDAACANAPPQLPLRASAVQWMAPECLRSDGHALSPASDVYSLGMCMLEAIMQGPPWGLVNDDDDAGGDDALIDKIEAGELPPFKAAETEYSDDVYDLITAMCAKDPESRMPLCDVITMLATFSEQGGDVEVDDDGMLFSAENSMKSMHVAALAQKQHTTKESKEIKEQAADVHNKTMAQLTEEHSKSRDHTTAELNSLREFIPPKKEDIWQLVHSLTNASDDEEKGKRSSELWKQCIIAEKDNAIPGLLALVKYSSVYKLPAAKKLSKLAKTQEHLEDIIANDGVEPLLKLACEASPDQIEPILATLGAIFYISKEKEDLDAKQIVEPLMLVLQRKDTNPGAKMMAAGVLYKLSLSETWRKEIAKHHGISALLDTIHDCRLDSVDKQLKTYALQVLVDLSNDWDCRGEVAEVIPELLKLLKMRTLDKPLDKLQESHNKLILDTLWNVSQGFHSKIVEANGLELLKRLVDFGCPPTNYTAKEYEVWALELLKTLDQKPPREPIGFNGLVWHYRYYRSDEIGFKMGRKEAADAAYYDYACAGIP